MNEIILIVDDNPELLDGVKLTLEMEKYQVLTALSAEKALEILERVTPDLILADIMMPNLDGYQFFIQVHHDPRWLHIPFIFLTAKTGKEDIRKGKEMGVDDYITKPFDPQDIVAAVRGRLKRLAELTGQPVSRHAIGNLKRLLGAKWGPVPVPLVVLLLLVLVVAAPLLVDRLVNQTVGRRSLRADVGETIVIPAGAFVMGANVAGVPNPHDVTLPAFEIDKYEVTFAQYKVFVEETGRLAPWGTYAADRDTYPVVDVSWDDAAAYCAWAGKRLPTEAEWEKAARGPEGGAYPWGDAWQEGLANTGEAELGGTQPVGFYPEGASIYGVMDMAGNVYEWVEDWADADKTMKVIRGGAWNAKRDWAQTFKRNSARPTEARDNLGFRCVQSVE